MANNEIAQRAQAEIARIMTRTGLSDKALIMRYVAGHMLDAIDYLDFDPNDAIIVMTLLHTVHARIYAYANDELTRQEAMINMTDYQFAERHLAAVALTDDTTIRETIALLANGTYMSPSDDPHGVQYVFQPDDVPETPTTQAHTPEAPGAPERSLFDYDIDSLPGDDFYTITQDIPMRFEDNYDDTALTPHAEIAHMFGIAEDIPSPVGSPPTRRRLVL